MTEKPALSRRDVLKILSVGGGALLGAGVGLGKLVKDFELIESSSERQIELRELFDTRFNEVISQQGGVTEAFEYLKTKAERGIKKIASDFFGNRQDPTLIKSQLISLDGSPSQPPGWKRYREINKPELCWDPTIDGVAYSGEELRRTTVLGAFPLLFAQSVSETQTGADFLDNSECEEQLSLSNYDWKDSRVKGFSLILPGEHNWAISNFDLTASTLLSMLVYIGAEGDDIVPKIHSSRRKDVDMLSSMFNERKIKCGEIYQYYRRSDIKGLFDLLLKDVVKFPDSWPKAIYPFRTMQVSAVMDMLVQDVMGLDEANQWWQVFKAYKSPNDLGDIQAYMKTWGNRLAGHLEVPKGT